MKTTTKDKLHEITKTTKPIIGIDEMFNKVWEDFENMLPYSLFSDKFPLLKNSYWLDCSRKQKSESDGTKTLTLNVPGFEKKDIKVNIENNNLVVEAANQDGDALELSEYVGDITINSIKLKNGQLKINYKPKQQETISLEISEE